MNELEGLYQEIILDHAKSPRKKLKLMEPAARAMAFNPLCGDEACLQAVVRDGKVQSMAFEGKGCAISQATSSMLCEKLTGRPLDEALSIAGDVIAVAKGESLDEARQERLGELMALSGVSAYPMRVKCATMPARAALEAMRMPIGETREVDDE